MEGPEADDLWDFGTVRHVGGGAGAGAVGSNAGARGSMEYLGPSGSGPASGRPGMNGRTATMSSSGSGSSNLPSAANITIKGDLPPGLGQPSQQQQQQNQARWESPTRGGTLRAVGNAGFDDDEEEEDEARDVEVQGGGAGAGDDYEARVMLDSVVLPAINSLIPRVSREAHVALTNLQRAFEEAERMIPGVTLEFVNEIVDSVEHVEEP
ncbi:putative protein serine/threonine kinase [Ceratobasidium sp. 392]|nr:putative protein serine/threonine kinase [Ceratobasidium sp. 392]